MRRTVFFCGVVFACWCCAPAPARAQNRVEQQMILDLRTLAEQNQRLMQQLNLLGEQITAVSAKVDAESNARSKGFADQQAQINSTNTTLSTLQERISENKVQVQKMGQELDAVRKGVDMLTVMVTQALAQMPAAAPPVDPSAPVDPNASPGAVPPPPVSPAASAGVPPSSRDYFDRAFSDYMVGQWEMAIQGFQEYVRRFPTAPSAAQAQFLIGECYFMMGKYEDAVNAYGQVIATYKGSDATPQVTDAYYKQGVAYQQLKQSDKATANFQLLRTDYPNSTAALLATQDLKRLGILK